MKTGNSCCLNNSALRNLSTGFPTRCNTNRIVKPQKIARGLQLRIFEVAELFYLCSDNIDAN